MPTMACSMVAPSRPSAGSNILLRRAFPGRAWKAADSISATTHFGKWRRRTWPNQPSNAKYIFGPSVWLRSLIKPPPGFSVAYIDWSQQEFGIAAALSGDRSMQDAYLSGDPYLGFAKQAGAVPE